MLEIGAGQVEMLEILLVEAKDIYGVDLQASFDPAVVEVVDTDRVQSGVQMTPQPFIRPDYVVLNLADNKKGMLHYVVTQLSPTLPANGAGAILSIQFRGKGTGMRTTLTFLSVQIANQRGVKLAVTAQGAELLVVPPKPATPTPAMIATIFSDTQIPYPPISTRTSVPVQPDATARPTEISFDGKENNHAFNDKILVYGTVFGFLGSAVLISLAVWLLRVKRQKGKTT